MVFAVGMLTLIIRFRLNNFHGKNAVIFYFKADFVDEIAIFFYYNYCEKRRLNLWSLMRKSRLKKLPNL